MTSAMLYWFPTRPSSCEIPKTAAFAMFTLIHFPKAEIRKDDELSYSPIQECKEVQ